MRRYYQIKILTAILLAAVVGISGGCSYKEAAETSEIPVSVETESTDIQITGTESKQTEEKETQRQETQKMERTGHETEQAKQETEVQKSESGKSKTIEWNTDWKYAKNSKIHSDSVTLYYASTDIANGKTVCVNAGHGTSGGSDVYTLCHPDGSPKVTGGSTGKGQTKAAAVAGGTTMNDGTSESAVTLKLALAVKEQLLAEGYNVLMIREDSDVQLDNIARTVMANQNADCHIALHYDSTQSDKGIFYIGVPDVDSYRRMEPVASHWQEHERLGEALIDGMKQNDLKIFGEGVVDIDLTQTSYSTIPSVDLEVGDRASDYSAQTLEKLAEGIAAGVEKFITEQ